MKAGNTIATDVKVLGVATKELLKTAGARGKGQESIFSQVDELAEQISVDLGLTCRQFKEIEKPIADVTTSSLEAYEYYLKGWQSYQKWDNEGARRYLEKAVQLDPEFAMAQMKLAWLYFWLRLPQDQQLAAWEKAKSLSERVTERERLIVDGYYAMLVEEDYEKEGRIFKELTEKYPLEKEGYYGLGGHYYYKDKDEEALKAYQKVLELDPYYQMAYVAIHNVYHYNDDYDKVVEWDLKYVSRFPENPLPLHMLSRAYLRIGRFDLALEYQKKVLEIDPDNRSGNLRMAYFWALEENYPGAFDWINRAIGVAPSLHFKAVGHNLKGFFYVWQGRLGEALDEFELMSDLARKVKNDIMLFFAGMARAWVYYLRGELELCQRQQDILFDSWIEKGLPDLEILEAYYSLRSGLVDLKAGRMGAAWKRLDRMRVLISTIKDRKHRTWKTLLSSTSVYLNCELLLTEGKYNEVADLCQKEELPRIIEPVDWGRIWIYNFHTLRDEPARAYHKKGKLDKAITEYQRLTTYNPRSKDFRLIPPTFHYRLGKLYEEKGLKDKAIDQYEKFLELWKYADDDLPEPHDARKRLARLKENK